MERLLSVITPLSPAEEAQQEQQASQEGWARRSLVAFDQMCNVIIFRGQPGETISTHAARAARLGHKWGIWLSAALNVVQGDHGAKARAGDIERAKNLLRVENAW